MKFILFLYVSLSAFVANAQLIMEIKDSAPAPRAAAPVRTSSSRLEIVINDRPDPNLVMSLRRASEARAAADCTTCRTDVSRAPSPIVSLRDTAIHLNQMNATEWANACSGFVKNGEIGPYGELIRSEILKPGLLQNIKRGDSDLTALCPMYPMMDEESKANVFLLIMTSMAFEESTCDNNSTARGPNGMLKGLFQLHSGREASYGPECRNYDSNTPVGSIMCSLSMINKQMGKGNLFRQDSNYWDVLRPLRWNKNTRKYFKNPSYTQIRSAVSDFPPCTQRQSFVRSSDVNLMMFQSIDRKIYHKTINVDL